jgi:predicted nucleic acid-binding protein
MNIVDSSGWLEYFADGPNADFFSRPLEETADLVVPTITIYEVFKVVFRQRGESEALQSAALMRQGLVVDLTPEISVFAAKTSVEHHLPMADSIILATSRLFGATIWTQDSDFKEIDGVRYVAKKDG